MTNSNLSPSGPAPRVSVVVPVRNEAGNVAPLIGEIARAMAALAPFEIIYVNDGSSDGTAAELRTLAEQYPYLRHVDHAVSCG
jgi:dolichol-phosphate mannosyltransferase